MKESLEEKGKSYLKSKTLLKFALAIFRKPIALEIIKIGTKENIWVWNWGENSRFNERMHKASAKQQIMERGEYERLRGPYTVLLDDRTWKSKLYWQWYILQKEHDRIQTRHYHVLQLSPPREDMAGLRWCPPTDFFFGRALNETRYPSLSHSPFQQDK